MIKICVYGTLRNGQGLHDKFLKDYEKIGTTKQIIHTPKRTLQPVTYPLTQEVCGCDIYEIEEQTYKAINEFEKSCGYDAEEVLVIDDITLEVHNCIMWVLR